MNKKRGVYTIKAGDRIHFWTVLADSPIYDRNRHKKWPVECICGDVRTVYEFHLRAGKPKSCGCRGPYERHRGSFTTEYNTWRAMKQRCLNPNHIAYRRYGGRGIQIHEPWINSFKTFLSDLGPRPAAGMSLDRRDNNGNYEPTNVRWATAREQSLNSSRRVSSAQ